ncbi:MAG: patatin-like phospholipase family protein [Flavobacteriales bacterium]|nr:patatin-like phospholipase family protein [Flavobacteriales bacterium]
MASAHAQDNVQFQGDESYIVYEGEWVVGQSEPRNNLTEESEQKVGLVLSGGGAKGLAHIGVIKALEENNIPIDYVSGTSMGAIVGGMYAVGLTPFQMESLVNSERFRNMATGKIEREYKFYFMKEDLNSSWMSMKVGKDSLWETTLPTSLINPVAIDFFMLENLSAPSAAAEYDFDKLFVPFRCVAADIQSKREVIFREGYLNEAIRASATFPFYLNPITIDGKLLFDGGLYNNFPTDVMYNEFYPDIILGSNVSSSIPPPTADNVMSQITNMLVRREDFTIICDNGILIQPEHSASTFAFNNVQSIIDSGYNAAMAKMPEIKASISRRVSREELANKRKAFQAKQPPLVIDELYVEGLNKQQSKYVRNLFAGRKGSQFTLDEIKHPYFRVFEDDKIGSIYPRAEYNKFTGAYDLYLDIRKAKEITMEVGGIVSSRPISGAYLGLKYNYLGKVGISTFANAYIGKLYSAAQLRTRIDFPIKLPIYVEPILAYNRWDYFKSSTDFFDNETPSYLVQKEVFVGLQVGFPYKNEGRIKMGSSFLNLRDEYYQTKKFGPLDTSDRTDFNGFSSYVKLERSTLNRKQYASEGTYFALEARHNIGQERETPGTTSANKGEFEYFHEWLKFKLLFNNYYKSKGKLRLGLFCEVVYSTQPLFNNYTASVLRAPAFQPNPESKTLFLESFRAHQYASIGQRMIFKVRPKVDLRVAGYLFQPHQSIIVNQDSTVSLGDEFDRIYTIATATMVFHSPIGPLSFSLNYYHNLPEIAQEDKTPLTFFFHFGYVIFNRRAVE